MARAHLIAATSVFTLAAAGTAVAQLEEAPAEGWTRSLELSAASATGNSETLNVGLAAEAKNEIGRYTHLLKGAFNYAEADEIETQNNVMVSYQLDVQLRDRTYAFGRTKYDRDEFSGFENRIFVGAGVGHYLYDNEKVIWKIEGGPGYRYSKLEEPDPVPADFEDTENEFALYASSEFAYAIREGVDFTHAIDTTYTDSNTSLRTIAALTTKLTDSLSSKVSYEVRYETDPPAGNENTDTLLKASVLFGF